LALKKFNIRTSHLRIFEYHTNLTIKNTVSTILKWIYIAMLNLSTKYLTVSRDKSTNISKYYWKSGNFIYKSGKRYRILEICDLPILKFNFVINVDQGSAYIFGREVYQVLIWIYSFSNGDIFFLILLNRTCVGNILYTMSPYSFIFCIRLQAKPIANCSRNDRLVHSAPANVPYRKAS